MAEGSPHDEEELGAEGPPADSSSEDGGSVTPEAGNSNAEQGTAKADDTLDASGDAEETAEAGDVPAESSAADSDNDSAETAEAADAPAESAADSDHDSAEAAEAGDVPAESSVADSDDDSAETAEAGDAPAESNTADFDHDAAEPAEPAESSAADSDHDSAEPAEASDAPAESSVADHDPAEPAEASDAPAEGSAADSGPAESSEVSETLGHSDAPDPSSANEGGLDATAPIATTISAGLSTLQDVRAGLLSEVEDEQAEVLRRNLAKAERRVGLLLEQGHDPTLIEGRLAAAQNLHALGESRSALLLVEELLVLAKTMLECGPLPKDPSLASAVATAAATLVAEAPQDSDEGHPPEPSFKEIAALLEHEHAEALALHRREIEAAQIRTEEELEILRERELPALRYEARRAQERALDDLRHDLNRKGQERLEERLSLLLSEERFAAAAAHATASRPGELIDRPELLARIDAVASRLDGAVLERAEVREAVDAKVREVLLRFIRGGDLARAIEPIVAAQGAPDVADQLRVLERQEKLVQRQAEALSGLQAMLEAEQARSRQREARLAALEERLAEAETALGEVDVSDQIRQGLKKALSSPGFSKHVGGEVTRHLDDPAFSERVAGLSQESVARELASPERVAGLVAAVVAARELVQRVLSSKELDARLGQERLQVLKLEAFAKRVRGLIESALPESPALRARVLELLDDEGTGGPIIDQRIDDRVAEKTDTLLDQRSVKRRITGAVRAEMVEDVFRKNVDARIHELAEEGFLGKRIKALLTQEMGPALDSALANSEVLRRLVLKEIRNREALQAAQLTGDGFSDPATALIRSGAMDELLDKKIREALRGDKKNAPAPASNVKGLGSLKISGGKSDDDKPGEVKPSGGKPSGRKSSSGKSSSGKPGSGKGSSRKKKPRGKPRG